MNEMNEYDHLSLCRRLKEDGICNDDDCQDGHNIGGICRRYISTGCRNDWCRFLHIKIKTIPSNHEIELLHSPDVSLHTQTPAEEDRRDLSEEYKVLDELYEYDEAEDPNNDPETERGSAEAFENDMVRQDDGGESAIDSVSEESPTQQRAELEIGKVALVTSEEAGEGKDETKTENRTEGRSEERITNHHPNWKQTSEGGKMQMEEKTVERDLRDFLWLGHRHDVWKEIKATKQEIRKLTRELRGKRKEQGDLNQ